MALLDAVAHHTLVLACFITPCKTYPHKDPILGLDLFIENFRLLNKGGFLDKLSERYYRQNAWTYTQLLFREKVINTADPENIKAILATQFTDFQHSPRRKAAFYPTFGHGIFTTDGAEWEFSRALLRPSFVRSQVGDLDIFEAHISHLINKIPRDGSIVDIQQLFFALTMDTATQFLFGQSANVLVEGEPSARGEKFAEAYDYVTEIVGIQAKLGQIVAKIPNKRYTDSIKYIHEYVEMYVQKAVDFAKFGHSRSVHDAEANGRESHEKYVFLEELAKTGVDKKKIRDELLNVLFAGRDTTAGLLSFTFYILARRPDVFEKLRAEVMTLGSERPDFAQIKNMKYLQYTLKEVNRLYPIVPFNARAAVRDTTLPVGGGSDGKSPILVKAGQAINYQIYTMHRRKDLYGEDALEFKPERWEHIRPTWQYLPFNAGPRICIGQQFALTEASYTIIRLLQAFKSIRPREGEGPLTELLALTSSVRGGVNIGLTPA
ncbi:cytochrome P450, putative [Talaromyces stipitatus ATCC 10500]|uniref:Cytochrome P450, putative n=1 Tax=Talaromyces stipitatus (strain ATCC 10500 / CBS 375.48 / QM 6759 / NRRL 1006) TaxID=441959 RepID=B8MCM6_TALSN|nr:cytochrome P450, putative [Talaromyces stipitatus ATCC 10500]EED18842.1 cytochrome P450, putative [Talaromyces stipitatus ATCC 10500]